MSVCVWCIIGMFASHIIAQDQPLMPAGDEPQQKADLRLKPIQFRVIVENDIYTIGNTDRWYTHGTALSLAYQPDWDESMTEAMPFAAEFGPATTAIGITIGQLIFTPEELSATAVQLNDRPYAGYFYGGLYWQRGNEQTLDHIQLDVGTVGPISQAGYIQHGLHEFISAEDPKGWSNQLSNELTFNFYLRKKWRHTLWQDGKVTWLQVIPQVGGAAGLVHRHLEAAVTLRAGFDLPDDFGPTFIDDLGSATGTLGDEGFGIYGYVRFGGKIVEHNLFLEGNNFDNSHHVEPRVFVGDIRTGIVATYTDDPWSFELGFSQIFQSPEFVGQDDPHSYGSIIFALTYWY